MLITFLSEREEERGRGREREREREGSREKRMEKEREYRVTKKYFICVANSARSQLAFR